MADDLYLFFDSNLIHNYFTNININNCLIILGSEKYKKSKKLFKFNSAFNHSVLKTIYEKKLKKKSTKYLNWFL